MSKNHNPNITAKQAGNAVKHMVESVEKDMAAGKEINSDKNKRGRD